MSSETKAPIRTGIEAKLTAALAPLSLEVIDESHRHAGHGHHHHPEGETHFRVEIVSAAFEGKSRIARHRMINALLAEELAGRVHALAIGARTPAEAS
jgi:BolA protein